MSRDEMAKKLQGTSMTTELYSYASNSKTSPPWDTRNRWNYQET